MGEDLQDKGILERPNWLWAIMGPGKGSGNSWAEARPPPARQNSASGWVLALVACIGGYHPGWDGAEGLSKKGDKKKNKKKEKGDEDPEDLNYFVLQVPTEN